MFMVIQIGDKVNLWVKDILMLLRESRETGWERRKVLILPCEVKIIKEKFLFKIF